MVELVGILGSVLVLIAITFPSTSKKGNTIMRILNLVGSIIFVVYGCLIPAYSTAIMNIAATAINLLYIFKLQKNKVE